MTVGERRVWFGDRELRGTKLGRTKLMRGEVRCLPEATIIPGRKASASSGPEYTGERERGKEPFGYLSKPEANLRTFISSHSFSLPSKPPNGPGENKILDGGQDV
jgi:hypothetical protein